MKKRTIRSLLAGVLAAAVLTTTIPGGFAPMQAKAKESGASQTLEKLGVIDEEGEEDVESDLPDIGETNDATPYAASNGDLVIAIDAGHGGTDGGATYDGMQEKTLNLSIAKYLKAYLEEYAGVQVYMTRTTDTYLDLSERVSRSVANNADVFISIHNNASSNLETSGSMVFYPNSSYKPKLSKEGSGLASSILSKLTALGLPDLGIRTRDSESGNTYSDGSIADYYGVIRNAKLQGITGIIVEHAFVSCAADRQNYLSTNAKLKKLALADAQGIAEYYGLVYNGLVEPEITLSSPSYKQLEVNWSAQEDAKGYLVYRSEKKSSGYARIAKVVGSANTAYVDSQVELGKTYYYKIRAYSSSGGTTFYSEYSDVVSGRTISGTKITGIKQMAGGYFKLSWTPYKDSSGYAIYRSENGGAYKRIATVSNPAKGAYNDKTAARGVTYSYKVRTLNTLYNNEGFGKSSTAVTATLLKAPSMKRLDVRDDGYIKVVWTKAAGASSYVVQRATSMDGTYKTVATITKDSQNYYVDKSVELGMTYYYRVNAYNKKGQISGSTGYVEPIGVKNIQTPELTSTRIAQSKPGVYLAWTKVAGAAGYRIYRSTTKSGGYKKVTTLKSAGSLSYIDESSTEAGTTYYYKVKAYVRNSAGTAWSTASGAKSVVAGYGIMGKSSTTVAKMAGFFEARGGVYPSEIYSAYGAPTLKDFCQIVYDEAVAEGVKAEVVFAQVCKETGFLRFGGDVEPEQCNFAGIGATGGGAKGASFPDVETGIRAQVQHLKAYACDEPLNQTCVDPRFSYVKRGSAPYVEWLGINENPTGAGWATGVNYGYSLRDDYIKPLLAY